MLAMPQPPTDPAVPPRRPALVPLLTVALLVSGPGVHAAAPPGSLEEVRVTATRIEFRWRDAPFAVSRVGREEIRSGRQQLSLDESLAAVPGMFFQNRYNFAQELRISIRGFGARANFGIRGIRVYADDIPLTMPDGQGNVDSIDLGSAEHIEVMRGPVSAIYGAAGGGVILVQSERGPENPMLSARLSTGSDGYDFWQAKAGGQFGPFNAMVNWAGTRLDGYRDHARFERDLLNTRFQYDLSADSSLTLVFNAVDSPLAQDPGALTATEAASNPRQAVARNVQFDASEGLDQQKIGLVFRSDRESGSGLLLRGYAIRRDFVNLLPFNINTNGQGGSVDLQRDVAGVGGHWSRAFALGGDRTNRLLLGFEHDVQRDLRIRYVNDSGTRGELTTSQDEDVTATGLFIENVTTFGERVNLTLGARLDEMDYEVTDRTGSGGSGEISFDEFSPMAGLSWARWESMTLYGNVSTSFDPPAFVEMANPEGPTGFNQALQPQNATNYELGAKGELEQAVRYELAVFHVAVEDEIIPYELGGSGQSFFRNAGESSHDGLEAALQWSLSETLTATATYAYSDFRFDQYLSLAGESFAGNRIPGVPNHQARLALDWSRPGGFFGGGDVAWTGRFYADDANRVETGEYFIANARAGYRGGAGRAQWELYGGINNLFDEDYAANIRSNAAFGRYYEPAPGRTYYAGFELRFDAR